MPTNPPSLWEQLTAEQQERILALLVQMLLRHLSSLELTHDAE